MTTATDKDIKALTQCIPEDEEKRGGTCSYALSYNGKIIHKNINAPCHASLAYGGHRPTALISDLRHRWYKSPYNNKNPKELDYKEFYNLILDEKDSPWREVIKGRQLVHNANGKPIAVVITDMTINARPLVNFLVATRFAYEHQSVFKTWEQLVQHGMNPNFALLVANIFPTIDGRLIKRDYDIGHQPFDTHQLDAKALIKGTPYYDKQSSYQDNNDYRPCNSIWKSPKKLKDHPRFNEIKKTRFSTINTGMTIPEITKRMTDWYVANFGEEPT